MEFICRTTVSVPRRRDAVERVGDDGDGPKGRRRSILPGSRGRLHPPQRVRPTKPTRVRTGQTGASTTALLLVWPTAIPRIDLSMELEPRGAFEAIARLKDDLDVNVELASPADFIPRLPSWRERCLFIESVGDIQFFHYDPYSQALSKLERGHQRDLDDVRQMLRRGLIRTEDLLRLFSAIEPELLRYPAVDPSEFRRKVEQFVSSAEGAS